jgi:hypothetical protein
MELKGKYIILEKLSGERYRADMLVGNRDVQGWCIEPPQVGYAFYLYTSPEDVKIGDAVIPKEDLLCAWTSRVDSIDLENNIIKTANSTYKIEIKDEQLV